MAPLFYCGKLKALMTRPFNDRPQTQNEYRIQYNTLSKFPCKDYMIQDAQ